MAFDHAAFQVKDVSKSIEWYTTNYDDCDVIYSDSTWGMIELQGVRIAFVSGDIHPPHIAITQTCPIPPEALQHRDLSYYIYDADPDGNVIERIWWPEQHTPDE